MTQDSPGNPDLSGNPDLLGAIENLRVASEEILKRPIPKTESRFEFVFCFIRETANLREALEQSEIREANICTELARLQLENRDLTELIRYKNETIQALRAEIQLLLSLEESRNSQPRMRNIKDTKCTSCGKSGILLDTFGHCQQCNAGMERTKGN